MKRLTAVVVVALLVFVAAFPAVGACCISKRAGGAATMHASMPCCADSCRLSNPDKNSDSRDVTLAPAPSTGKTVPGLAALQALASVAVAPASDATIDGSPYAFCQPPPFLLHRQFRI
jgi:hypothetical protein